MKTNFMFYIHEIAKRLLFFIFHITFFHIAIFFGMAFFFILDITLFFAFFLLRYPTIFFHTHSLSLSLFRSIPSFSPSPSPSPTHSIWLQTSQYQCQKKSAEYFDTFVSSLIAFAKSDDNPKFNEYSSSLLPVTCRLRKRVRYRYSLRLRV